VHRVSWWYTLIRVGVGVGVCLLLGEGVLVHVCMQYDMDETATVRLLQTVADCCRLLQTVADCCRLLQTVASDERRLLLKEY